MAQGDLIARSLSPPSPQQLLFRGRSGSRGLGVRKRTGGHPPLTPLRSSEHLKAKPEITEYGENHRQNYYLPTAPLESRPRSPIVSWKPRTTRKWCVNSPDLRPAERWRVYTLSCGANGLARAVVCPDGGRPEQRGKLRRSREPTPRTRHVAIGCVCSLSLSLSFKKSLLEK